MRYAIPLAAAALLAACQTQPQASRLSFEQAQRECFDHAVASVPTKPGETVKAAIGPDGSFRGGIFKDGFLRGNVTSAQYDLCMAERYGAVARGSKIEVTDGVFLTPDEKLAWDQMTPEERERVRLFMINGGTFASALGSDT
ncbi:MAG: hypothetical protein ACE5FS_05335 [Paracoccaceae bacterium]